MRTPIAATLLLIAAASVGSDTWLDIVVVTNESLVELAARQLRRYLHVLDRRLPLASIVTPNNAGLHAPRAPARLYLATSTGAVGAPFGPHSICSPAKNKGCFMFDTSGAPAHMTLVGSEAVLVLHGVMTILGRLGVRFTADGPMLPASAVQAAVLGVRDGVRVDERSAAAARFVSGLAAGGPMSAAPVFEYRGFQPWGSYPIGNDWWDVDEYRRVVELIVTLRGNWIGMHDYANNYPFPEPGVAVLLDTSGLAADGNLSAGGVTYSGTWAASERAAWGLDGAPTGSYAYGAAALYDWDCFANRAVAGGDASLCPTPADPSGVAETFNRVGALYASAFALAARLNVSTALGTEIPLSLPSPGNGSDALVPLYVWWSAARNDTFVTTTQCAECEGLYVSLGTAGYVYAAPGPGRVALQTYWAPAYLDALLTVDAPTDPAYAFTRIEGYGLLVSSVDADDASTAPPAGLLPLQQESRTYVKELIGDKTSVDTWAVSGAEFSANASARGYAPVGGGGPMAWIAASGTPADSALFGAYNATLARMALLYGTNLTWYWAWTAVGAAGGLSMLRLAAPRSHPHLHRSSRRDGSGARSPSSTPPSLPP